MSIEILLAVLSFGWTCFGIGYAMGWNNGDKWQ